MSVGFNSSGSMERDWIDDEQLARVFIIWAQLEGGLFKKQTRSIGLVVGGQLRAAA